MSDRIRFVGYRCEVNSQGLLTAETLARVNALLVVGRLYTPSRCLPNPHGCCDCAAVAPKPLAELAEVQVRQDGCPIYFCLCGFRPEVDGEAVLAELRAHLEPRAVRTEGPAG
jgi:hypothetical protein